MRNYIKKQKAGMTVQRWNSVALASFKYPNMIYYLKHILWALRITGKGSKTIKKVQIFWTANLKVAWGRKTRRGEKASNETGERKVKLASIEKFLWDIYFLRQTSGLNSKYLLGLLWQLRLKRAGAD